MQLILQAARIARVSSAIYEIDYLFRHIPCFASNPQQMIYELNRCTFMTSGNRRDTIELLALVAAKYDDMSTANVDAVLGSLLQQKTSGLIMDYFSSGSSTAGRAKQIGRRIGWVACGW